MYCRFEMTANHYKDLRGKHSEGTCTAASRDKTGGAWNFAVVISDFI